MNEEVCMKKLSLLVLVLVFTSIAVVLYGQFTTVEPPKTYGNPDLRNIKIGYVIPELCDGGGKYNDAWSSTFLKAEGKPPVKPEPTGDEDADMQAEYEYAWALANWASMYSAQSLMDNNPETCWVEGVKGPGIGEVVIAPIPGLKNIGIRNGFQKNADLYNKNARPKKIKVWLLAAERKNLGEAFDFFINVKTYAVRETELKDAMGWQELPLPVAPANVPKTQVSGMNAQDLTVQWFVAIQIVSVYPGSKWEDCCISDIGEMK